MALLVDVSNNNGSVDWVTAHKVGVAEGWTKATEGKSFLDGYLKTNIAGMRAVGIQDGQYHFARPGEGDPIQQADWFVDNVLRAGGYGVKGLWLDVEDNGGLSKAALTAWMLAFLHRVDQRTGKTTGIYCSPYFADDHFDMTKFSDRPLWLADYGVPSPRVPYGRSSWDYWQYTSTGKVDGINGPVDLNYYKGEVQAVQILMQGSAGEEVKALQENLNKLLGVHLTDDGNYGPATASAVKSFQLQHKLTVDGIAGTKTLTAIEQAVKALTPPAPAKPVAPEKPTIPEPTPAPAPAPAPTTPTVETLAVDKTKLVTLQNQLKNTLASVEALLGGNA